MSRPETVPIRTPLPIGGRLGTRWGPHIYGHAIELNGTIYINWVQSTAEATGEFGRWLDNLDPCVVFATVISGRLEGMLLRRGWETHHIKSKDISRAINSCYPKKFRESGALIAKELGINLTGGVTIWRRCAAT